MSFYDAINEALSSRDFAVIPPEPAETPVENPADPFHLFDVLG